jgi:hypothetical protein
METMTTTQTTTTTETTMTTTSISQLIRIASQYRAYVRTQVLRRNRGEYSIEIVDGDAAPKATGDSWHYETRGGTWITHPSAYSKSGWSNMVYCSSTLAVRVGREWLAARRIPEWAMVTTRDPKQLVALGACGQAGQGAQLVGMAPERVVAEIGARV